MIEQEKGGEVIQVEAPLAYVVCQGGGGGGHRVGFACGGVVRHQTCTDANGGRGDPVGDGVPEGEDIPKWEL